MKNMRQSVRTAVLFTALLAVCTVGAQAAEQSLGVGTVNVEGLNLRSEPSTESTILDTAYFEEKVMILEDVGDNWYKVDYDTVQGYMFGDYLDVAAQVKADLGYGEVDVSSVLNVRSGPGTDYDKVSVLSDNDIVKLTGFEDGWYHISFGDDKTGYVSSEYIVRCKNSSGAKSAGSAVPADATMQEKIVAYAKEFLGVPYVYGGNGPDCFDCSGFTKYVYNHFGYKINRTASYQLDNGVSVSKDELQPGDLVFFRRATEDPKFRASHVGIYIGDDKYIHASSDDMKVVINTLSVKKNYIGARRIV